MNALTIDVEDYFHVQAFANVIVPNDWCRYPMRVESNTYRLLELLDRRAVRATFFMLGWVAERCPSLVRHILDGGHEIGSHGYGHQMISRGDEKTFRRDVGRAKSILEDQTGTKVKGYRAPSYSITSKTLWALEVLGELGFEYDSSIFPVRSRLLRYSGCAALSPLSTAPRAERVCLSFRRQLLRAYATQSSRLREADILGCSRIGLTAWAIRRINQKKSSRRMVYLHPWEIDPDQPRVAAAWRSQFRHYQNLRATEKNFAPSGRIFLGARCPRCCQVAWSAIETGESR